MRHASTLHRVHAACFASALREGSFEANCSRLRSCAARVPVEHECTEMPWYGLDYTAAMPANGAAQVTASSRAEDGTWRAVLEQSIGLNVRRYYIEVITMEQWVPDH